MNEYDQRLKAFYDHFGCAKEMVLATSKKDRVSARTMSVVLLNGDFLFQTDKTFLKYEQISANPLVALCIGNIQIEGVATDAGHPLTEDNRTFAAAFQQSYPNSFNAYSHLQSEVVIQVRPTKITLWEYESGKPYRTSFCIPHQTYARELYSGE